jgi:hypothetical protein
VTARSSPRPVLALLAVLAAPPLLAEGTPPAVRSSGPAIIRAETAALLLSGQSGGSLPLGLLPLSEPPLDDASEGAVTLVVDVPLRPDDAGALELFAYLLAAPPT